MNIGSLFRGLLGDSKPGEAKSLELKEGQVVRGVVLSVSESGKEAVVQIQGTPVRAELETPLTPGQSMTLQVAPPGEGGLPVLKPMSMGEAALASPQSMGEALEQLGLKDAKAGKEIIQAIQSGGLPLTKETAAKLDAIMSAKPQGVATQEWLESAVLSMKRGLPVTAESVRGLQQAVFGPKLHELLAQLETELNAWAQQESDAVSGKTGAPVLNKGASASVADHAAGSQAASAGSGAAETEEAAGAAKTSAASAAALSGARTAASTGMQVTGAGAADDAVPSAEGGLAAENDAGEAAAAKGAAGKETPASGTSAAGNPAARAAADTVGTAVNPQSADAGEADGAAGAAVKLGSAESAGQASAAARAVSTDAAGTAGKSGAAEPAADGSDEPADAAAKGGAVTKGADGQPAPSGGALLAKLQGVLTELRGTLPQLTDQAGAAAQPEGDAPPAAAGQEPARAAGTPRGDSPAAAQQPGQAPAPAQDTASWVGRVLKLLGAEHEQQAVRGGAVAAQAASGGADAADTLKGVLLQVMGSSDAPPAVKDAAGQLVAQLTGQQLLMNTDRTAPFAQVTMFLPLRGPDGEETASVHIQSRRGRKGELDAANCRLWFDLDMKQLGQTLVDVQVVDRIVSLKLHNNDPWVLELLEGRRDDVAAAVESIGYQLSSLRTEPLPEVKAVSGPAGAVSARRAKFTPDSYKGVDYRI
ncbi:DNA ligase [Paenibacillus sp. FSL R7-0345]|uniref:DNA ligase n=1 Tax=Paenibacillus sp. FSL R7-0345 TaxID=2954535 RepID=UPI00315A1163